MMVERFFQGAPNTGRRANRARCAFDLPGPLTLAIAMAALIGTQFTLATSAEAARGDRWKRIAVETIDIREDEASIDLTSASGKYKAFRLRVRGRTLKFRGLSMTYAEGDVFRVDKSFRLGNRERTKTLDEQEDGRFIDKLTVLLDPVETSRKRTSRLEVWALQNRKDRTAKRFDDKLKEAADAAAVAAGEKPGEVRLSGTPPLPSQVAPGATSPAGDVLFGVQYVGFGLDHDVIRVGRQLGKFSRLRIRVLDNDIHLNKLTVIYGNGKTQDIAVDTMIARNQKTQWFDLKGDRFVDSVELSYRSRPDFNGQARVEVFGEHSDGWLGPNGEGRKFNKGWVLLAAQTAGFIGFDKDVIPVGDNEGGFSKIRVNVRDRAITLNEIRVVYAGGAKDIIPVRTRVDAGSTYGPIELRSDKDKIEEIQARYRSRVIDSKASGRGSAVVEIWAKH